MTWSFVLLVGIALSYLLISGVNVNLVGRYFHNSAYHSYSFFSKISKGFILFLVFASTFLLNGNKALGQCPTTITLTPAQSGTWTVPAGVTSITVQAWAGGGGGAGRTIDGAGGGGGGGAFMSSVLSVTPGDVLTINVGAGGASNTNGGDSWISPTPSIANAIFLAEGGLSSGANNQNGARGGSAANGIPSGSGFDGGNGANGFDGTPLLFSDRRAGGGGGGAGPLGIGQDASGITGGGNGNGGGNGGNAPNNNDGNGANGIPLGGGGAGSVRTGTNGTGGSGGDGQIIISYTIPANTSNSAAPNRIVCINNALSTVTNITHSTIGATGILNSGVSGANGLPPGVNAVWTSTGGNTGTITISGTPTSSALSPYNYSIPMTGGCTTGQTAVTGTITVTPTAGTPTAITGTPPSCQITNGTTTTTFATTATNNTGFNWSLSNAAAGTINPTTGVMAWTNGFSGSVDIIVTANGCNGISAQTVRTVSVTPTVGTPTAITGTPPACQIINSTTTTTFATTATNNTGFNWSLSNTAAGIINPTTGVMTWSDGFSGTVDIRVTANGCNGPSAQIIRTVSITPNNTASPPSTYPSVCRNNTPISNGVLTPFTHTTTGATGILNPGVSGANGLPPGISASFSGNTITIGGTITTAVAPGFYNYAIPLTGGSCPTVNATGTIEVTPVYTLTTTTSVAPSNTGGAATITITGNPAVLIDGTYQVTYSIGAPNASGPTATTVIVTSGRGSFSTTPIGDPNLTTLTISQIRKITDACTIPISTNNVTTFGISSVVYNTSGTFFVPAGIFEITLKVWGAGGGGGNGISGAGGAGGGYSQVTIPVTPGEPIGLFVGIGGAAQANGGDSWATRDSSPPNAISNSLVYAKGGRGANGSTPGTYSTLPPILTRPGYGTSANGLNGLAGNGGNGGNGGGIAGSLGGNGGLGGSGVAANINGGIGQIRGGGGGGSKGASVGGAGGNGFIQISYPFPQGSPCFTIIDDGARLGTTVIEFTSNCTWTTPEGLTSYEVLVVGGGGAGGRTDNTIANQAGGGGGGAEVSPITSFTIPVGTSSPTTTITIGAGGTGSSTNPADRNGKPSSFSNGTTTITAQGGGAGGLGVAGSLNGINGVSTSSGGGGGANSGSEGSAGNRAGSGSSTGGSKHNGGGGGGSGGLGTNAEAAGPNGTPGMGGTGVSSLFTGSPRFFSAGGGGGSRGAASSQGGSGIGGAGGSNSEGGNALANSGSGGGGAGGLNRNGGNGGSGIVLIRYDNFRILPVEFLYFDAKYNSSSRSGDLTWATAKEWESSHFEIERSVNGVSDWNKISIIEAQGYSEIPTEYSLSDSKLPASGGIVYYRLKQVDFNGKFSYSNTKSIKVEALKGTGAWIAYPNPSSKKNMVTLDLIDSSVYSDDPIIIRISDIKGVSETYTVNQIESVSQIVNAYLDRSISGMYVLQLIWGNNSQQIKLLRN